MNDWRSLKISEFANTQSGGTPSTTRNDYWDGNIPWINSGELKDCTITKASKYITELGLANSSARLFPKNSVVIALTGATTAKLGILGLETSTNQSVTGIIPNKDFDSKFLFYQLFSLREEILSKSLGTAQPHINKRIVDELVVKLPPIKEQLAIVSKLEELLSDLENGKQQLQTAQQQLKIYRQSLLKWAFEGRLTNTSVKDGQLPEGWELLKLKDITLDKEGLRRGPFGSAIKKEFFVAEGYKVYEQGNAINNDPYRGKYFINEQKYQDLINFKVIPSDLIVSCSGVTLGRICELPFDAKPGVINQALLRIRLKKDVILNQYFVFQFRGAFFQKKIFDQSQGTAMQNLVGIKDFKEIEMLIPPIEEQILIIQTLESKLTVCYKIEGTITQSLLQAETLKQSILKSAFEGRLV
ncbi:MAG: restriction endonuclease subunit S [Bacteroidetes bacterium]|nr:restriction endonuclease subunit S [Bacteroidota bacterium]